MKMLEKTVLFYILKIDQEKDVESEVSGLELWIKIWSETDPLMKALVGVTDNNWFDFLIKLPEIDEANFWLIHPIRKSLKYVL